MKNFCFLFPQIRKTWCFLDKLLDFSEKKMMWPPDFQQKKVFETIDFDRLPRFYKISKPTYLNEENVFLIFSSHGVGQTIYW